MPLARKAVILLCVSIAVVPQTPTAPEALIPGQPHARTLAGPATHRYRVEAAGVNTYCEVIVDQRGADVVLSLFTPAGVKLAEVDSPNGSNGPERLMALLEAPGSYRVDVAAFDKGASGGYEVRVEALRPAAEADRSRARAARLFEEATRMRRIVDFSRGEPRYLAAPPESQRAAVAKFEEAARLFHASGDTLEESDAVIGLARTLGNLMEHRKAIEAYGQALTLKQKLGDRALQAATFSNIGLSYFELAESGPAIENFAAARDLYRALRMRGSEADSLTKMGRAYDQREQREAALEAYGQALELLRALNNRAAQAEVLFFMGISAQTIGDYPQSIRWFREAADVAVAAKSVEREGTAWRLMARAWAAAGNIQSSLDSFNRALLKVRAAGDKREESRVLGEIGMVYMQVGDYAMAADWLQRALPLIRAAGDRGDEATVLASIGEAHRLQGDLGSARNFALQALEIRKSLGNPRGHASSLHSLAVLADAQRNGREALDYFEQALAMRRAAGDRRNESVTMHRLAFWYHLAGNPAKASEYSDAAVKLAPELGDRAGDEEILYMRAMIERDRNNLNAARSILEKAIGSIESVRSTLASQAMRTTYFATVDKIYRLYADVLMRLAAAAPAAGLRELAVEAAERLRARSLLELLAESRAGIQRGADPDLIAKERHVQARLNAKEQQRMRLVDARAPAGRLAEQDQEIARLTAEYEEVRAELRARSPRFAELTQPRPLKLEAIRDQILDDDTLLIEYMLGGDRSYVFAISRSGVEGFALPNRAAIEALARSAYAWLAAPARTPRTPALAELSGMILGPLARHLGKRRLLVVADGALEYVPFAALDDPNFSGQPLAVNHELVSLPSASTLAMLRSDQGRRELARSVAIIADPVFTAQDSRVANARAAATPAAEALQRAMDDGLKIPRLPGTRREAAAIRALLPSNGSTAALDFDASRETMNGREVSEAGIVHLATHGLLNTVHPALSGIVLSLVDRQGKPKDGFVRLHEIFNLELKAGLVVLSACQTGLGKEVRGEGLVGLTRGFMYAGAPRVVASLWKVDDRATAELMRVFYQEMLGPSRQTPAAALRAAQLSLAKSKAWSDPYYWAAFILQGEWK